MGLAVVLVVALVGVGTLQLLPLLDRKATIANGETTTGTVTAAEHGRNTYSVTYEYTVDGETYESGHVFPGPYAPRGTGSNEVMDAVPLYDPPEQTTVYYDARDPGTAWLVTRDEVVSRHVMYFFAAGAVAVLLVAYLYVEWRVPAALAGGDGDRSNATGGSVGERAMAAAMTEYSGDAPSEEEVEERMAAALPDDAVQQARTPDGGLDREELAAAMEQRADTGGGGRSSGLFGRIGQVMGLLKVAALILLLGGALLVGTSVFLGQFLTP
jgi:hypothetical protein